MTTPTAQEIDAEAAIELLVTARSFPLLLALALLGCGEPAKPIELGVQQRSIICVDSACRGLSSFETDPNGFPDWPEDPNDWLRDPYGVDEVSGFTIDGPIGFHVGQSALLKWDDEAQVADTTRPVPMTFTGSDGSVWRCSWERMDHITIVK